MTHAVQLNHSDFGGKNSPAICGRFKLPADFSLTRSSSFLMSLSVLCQFHHELVIFFSIYAAVIKTVLLGRNGNFTDDIEHRICHLERHYPSHQYFKTCLGVSWANEPRD